MPHVKQSRGSKVNESRARFKGAEYKEKRAIVLVELPFLPSLPVIRNNRFEKEGGQPPHAEKGQLLPGGERESGHSLIEPSARGPLLISPRTARWGRQITERRWEEEARTSKNKRFRAVRLRWRTEERPAYHRRRQGSRRAFAGS